MEPTTIYRTRNRDRAVRAAKELAHLTGRCFQVSPFDSRTYELTPQRRDVPVRVMARYRTLAIAITQADKVEDN